MEIIGQEVRSKATGVKCEIAGIEKGKVLVDIGSGKPVSMPLDMLLMPDELRAEILKALNPKGSKKVLTGIAGIIDVRRAPEDIKNPAVIKELHKGDCFGTKAIDIYKALCENENFKWNSDVAWNFGSQQHLYSVNATKEGYSVWMLAHSSYNGSITKSERVYNKITNNGDVVEEFNDDTDVTKYTIGSKRVVFIKNACGQYIFWGTLETSDISPETKEVVHKYISDTYVSNSL